MKIITMQVEGQPLTVRIEYPRLDKTARRVIEKVKSLDTSLVVKDVEKFLRVELSDIYYIENVERKLFVYTCKEVYRVEGSMLELEKALEKQGVVRVSRTCLLNIDHMTELKQIKNSHLEAILDNDEKIIVTRKYLINVKNVFRRMP